MTTSLCLCSNTIFLVFPVARVKLPSSVDGNTFVKTLREVKGVTVAGGQGHLKGKIFRIAHMGYCNQYDMIVVVAAVEEVLAECGYSFEKGIGLKVFQETFLNKYTPTP